MAIEHNAAQHIHKGAYVQTSDPGAVGAKILWIDITSTPNVLKRRNDANTGWTTVDLGGGSLAPTSVFNVKDYGAVGNGSTDDTTALRDAATAAMAVNGQVYIPPGTYKWGGSGATTLFDINKSIRIFGAGSSSILLTATGTPSTAHFVRWNPPANGFSPGYACNPADLTCEEYDSNIDNRGYEVDHLTFRCQTPGQAGDCINIDVDTALQYIHDCAIHHNFFESVGGRSIHIDNSTGSQVNFDSAFRISIRNNWLYDGLLFEYAADSISIIDNTFRGFKTSEVYFTGGAANFRFMYNNFVSGGGFWIRNGVAPIIVGNYMELFQPGSTGSSGAILNVGGDLGAIDGAVVRNNVLGDLSGVGLNGISVYNATNAVIADNWGNIPSGKVLIKPEDANVTFLERAHNVVVGGGTDYPATPLGVSGFSNPVRWDTLPSTNQSGGIGVEKVRAGQLFTSFIEESTNQTLTLTDQVTALAMFSGADVALPQNTAGATIAGRLVCVVKGDTDASPVVVSAFAGDTIIGTGGSVTSISLATQGKYVWLQASSVVNRWFVVNIN